MKLSRTFRVVAVLVGVLMTAGCRFDGINSLPLPGNAIHNGSYTVQVELRDAQNLVGNSIVKADNVTVGTITSITTRNMVAVIALEIDDAVRLPANVTARLAQSSVLGAQYLELSAPTDRPADGRLQDGATIPLSASAEYPATEEVLAALSLVLNGSGLEQIHTIVSELNEALGGKEDAVRRSFDRIVTFVDGLDTQRENIVRAIDSLAAFATELAMQKETLRAGIEQIQPAVAILDEQRTQLTAMLDAVGRFGDKAAQVLQASRDDLTATLGDLRPTLSRLAVAGSDLTGALLVGLTLPFPVTVAETAIRGDYVNLFLTLDLSLDGIQRKIIGSIPVSDLVPMSNHAVNPLTAPLQFGPTDVAPPEPETNGGR
ncbi:MULTISPECIES: MCE family protein [Nocardia]|uniref:MCE family protein n=1 Tax=Nocardia TaxID=1817 RepID=UPI0007EC0D87|nr:MULTISPECIES: MCE family protein [Nocardia]MBF6278417.1 MCE family protein [Nocardia nova]OBA50502.1 mammalian cell entry protein [Nocardia sp. 852002-51101_SCH5132738]OBB33865.1 mammalian cell entry protein [Nocardia sp. 852002-51244_SCH5132740]OBF69658.1 mammalian cell entry protein [Mycobacterium sp. 852002-51759_SCH5129042]